jgi:hypothetical protein
MSLARLVEACWLAPPATRVAQRSQPWPLPRPSVLVNPTTTSPKPLGKPGVAAQQYD